MTQPSEAVRVLRTPEAVRERCETLLAWSQTSPSAQFDINWPRLPSVVDCVVDNIRHNYPSLDIPYHSRWRHFTAAGIDRWSDIRPILSGYDADEVARTRFDVTIVSVLLDAGAGPHWRFVDPRTQTVMSRSEGLAFASLTLLESGALSCSPDHPLSVDAGTLADLSIERLAHAFQVRADNPLAGLEGRVGLLRRLGEAVRSRPDLFGTAPARPGNLYDVLRSRSHGGPLEAREVLLAVLDGFSPIWPERLHLDGQPLGDVWRHPAIERGDGTHGLIPFHKLSQWLCYSIIEPLEDAGIRISGIDALTGLAEYRNGGLLTDLGLITPRTAGTRRRIHEVADPFVVEWRALTVAMLDRLAPLVCEALGIDDVSLPLVKILQGGTWDAGRQLAAQRRADGGPPFQIHSDGTVF